MDEPWIFLNGNLVAESRAVISVYDRGFLYGDGIFETLRAYQGKIFRAREHLSRLFQSAEAISLSIPFSPEDLLKALAATLAANKLEDAYLRITVSRGPDGPGLEPRPSVRPTVVIIAKAFPGYPEEIYRDGVAITLVKTRKTPASSLSPKIKSLNYLNPILAKIEARASGAFEGILLDQAGYICEGTVSNIFLVRKGELLTPDSSCGILEGITRQAVLELARKARIPVREAKYPPHEIMAADECFLTNSLIELLPAVRITGPSPTQDSRQIGQGQVGPITRQLRKSYRELVRNG